MAKRTLEDKFIEHLIIKAMLLDENFTVTIFEKFKPEYFDSESVKIVFSIIKDHFQSYNSLPEKSIIINSTDEKDSVKELFDEIDSIDYDIAKNYDHLFAETNEFIKEKAYKWALMESIDLLDKNENLSKSRELIEDALCTDLTIDLGINYWKDFNPRMKRILNENTKKVQTHYPSIDSFISGGFPEKTLSVILAKIHGGKTQLIVNFASRMALNGKNVVYFSFEMADMEICKRLDAIHTQMHINTIYNKYGTKEQEPNIKKLITGIKDIQSKNENLGHLVVKEFPTGGATVGDMKAFLRELTYRKIKPDIVLCDYLNLIKPNDNKKQRHEQIKEVAHSLRRIGYEYKLPVVSVSQLNREGMFSNFDSVDLVHQSEGIEISAIADFIAILGKNDDKMVYESEIHGKIVKNRLGGRVGEFFKLFLDNKSLKFYDEDELPEWIEETKKSGATTSKKTII